MARCRKALDLHAWRHCRWQRITHVVAQRAFTLTIGHSPADVCRDVRNVIRCEVPIHESTLRIQESNWTRARSRNEPGVVEHVE